MITVWTGPVINMGATRPLVFLYGSAGGVVTPPSQRGDIDYDQTKASARRGDGPQFQMAGLGTVIPGHVPVYDSQLNLIDSGTTPGGGGSVTSVALTVPSRQTVTGSPITTAGTLAITDNTENANLVFAGPSSGSSATPTFRALVAADASFALSNPMTTAGDIIDGGSGGAPQRLGIGSTGQVLTVVSGAPAWAAASGGGGLFGGITAPTLASTGLSSQYGGSGTFAAANTTYGVSLSDVSQSYEVEGVVKAYPGVPYTLTTLVSIPPFPANYQVTGLVIANTLSTQSLFFNLLTSSSGLGVGVRASNSPTSFNSDPLGNTVILMGQYIWLRLRDDGTSIYCSISSDGQFFTQVYTVTRASSFLGSSGFNYLGFAINPQGRAVGSTLMAWIYTTP